jgi:hypothetical protein
MQQRQSSVAAFIHYCFLARRAPELARLMLTGVDSSTYGATSESVSQNFRSWLKFLAD